MPKIRTMGAGLAGSTARNVSVNSNTGGGNKKQGLSNTTNKRVQFVSNAIKTRSYGENRNVIFCVNQLGGAGAVSGGNGSRMFGTTSDGVKDCITGPYGCEQVVREAYLEAYGREPDKSGLRTYCIAMTKRRWSKSDIIADLVKNGDSLACNTDSESESICGHVIDGSISGATVTQMQNGVNVVIGATNAQGNFDLTLADTSENASPFVATGGTDIATGLPNKLTLKSNGAVISPTTTVSVVIREANTSLTVDDANQLAADYLGITKDQVTSDYVNDLESSDVDVVTSALVSQRASVQIATIIETAAILSEEENNESVLFTGLGNLIVGDATVVVTDTTATTDIVNNSSGATIDTTTLSNISLIIADVFNDSSVTSSSQVNQVQVEVISQAEDDNFVNTISSSVLDEDGAQTVASNIVDDSTKVELPGSEIRPVITLIGDATVTHEGATEYIDAGATATDSGGNDISVTKSGTVNINVVGTYSIMYSATDGNGLQAVQLIRSVNVVDTTAPVITLIGDATVTHEGATVYTDAGATASDTMDGDITDSIVTTSTVDADAIGTYTVTYNVSDQAGNQATEVTRTVIVEDTTPPVINLIGDASVTHEGATSYTDQGATATDSLDNTITDSIITTGVVDINTKGIYTKKYNVTDNAGNAATEVTRTVNVVDTTPPVITINTNIALSTHELGSDFLPKNGVTAIDTMDGNLTSIMSAVITDENNVVRTREYVKDNLGTYTITYNVSDNEGNQATEVTRTVIVEDTTPPSLVSVTANDNTYKIDDNIDITVTWNENVVVGSGANEPTLVLSNNATALYQSGNNTTALVFRYTVVEGNTDSTDLQVSSHTGTITDASENPFSGTVSGDLGNVIVDANPPIVAPVSIVSNNNNDTSFAKAGDTITLSFEVNEALLSDPTVQILGKSATKDNSSTGLEYVYTSEQVVSGDAQEPAGFSISVTDEAGNVTSDVNETTDQSSVTIDTTAPTTQDTVLDVDASVVVQGDTSVTIVSSGDASNDVWLAPANTTDFSTGNTNMTKASSGEATSIVAPTNEDTYYIYVIDEAGNRSNPSTATVTVDNTAPVITPTNNTDQYNIVEFGGSYSEQGATADGNENVTSSGNVDTTTVGQYIITYSATDAAGNIGTTTRTVTVVDTTAPVITLSGSATVNIVKGSTYTDAGATATDNYDTSVTVSSNVSSTNPDMDVQGTYTITYNASDSSGNTALPVTRTVNVENPNVVIGYGGGAGQTRSTDLPIPLPLTTGQTGYGNQYSVYKIQTSHNNQVRLLFNVPVQIANTSLLPYILEANTSTEKTATASSLATDGSYLDLTFPSFNPAGNNYIYIKENYLTYDNGTSTTASVVATTRKVLWVE